VRPSKFLYTMKLTSLATVESVCFGVLFSDAVFGHVNGVFQTGLTAVVRRNISDPSLLGCISLPRSTYLLPGLANRDNLEQVQPEGSAGGKRNICVVGGENEGGHFRSGIEGMKTWRVDGYDGRRVYRRKETKGTELTIYTSQ
jgi:hypothetical protein